MVLTQEGWSGAHYILPNQYAIVEFNASTLENVSYLHLNCAPGFSSVSRSRVHGVDPLFQFNVAAQFHGPRFRWTLREDRLANISMPIWAFVLSSRPREFGDLRGRLEPFRWK